MKCAAVIEKAEGNGSAGVPDLPGCIAAGAVVEEVEAANREANAFRLDGLREDGLVISASASKGWSVELAAQPSPKVARDSKAVCATPRRWLVRFVPADRPPQRMESPDERTRS